MKIDCFAFSTDNGINGCVALDSLYCKRENYRCNFYKTREQLNDQKKKCEQRLYELGRHNI